MTTGSGASVSVAYVNDYKSRIFSLVRLLRTGEHDIADSVGHRLLSLFLFDAGHAELTVGLVERYCFCLCITPGLHLVLQLTDGRLEAGLLGLAVLVTGDRDEFEALDEAGEFGATEGA
jgi:hypothetical protein